MSVIFVSIIALTTIAIVAAIVLYIASQKFKVFEDERISLVESALPGVNCGGCGFAGCKAFAEACVGAETLNGLNCPVGGLPVMTKVSEILGKEAVEVPPFVAVVRCSGSCEHREKKNKYDGARTCAIAASLYAGETDCAYGCLGYGDCVTACQFDAIFINPDTQLPEVDEEKCTACGACVKACPKIIIELRKKGPKSRRIYVSCVNKDKGGLARKACSVACIGCGKCEQVCAFDAITIKNNLAYIDADNCRLCRKCVSVCPTNAILEVNFLLKKEPLTELKSDLKMNDDPEKD